MSYNFSQNSSSNKENITSSNQSSNHKKISKRVPLKELKSTVMNMVRTSRAHETTKFEFGEEFPTFAKQPEAKKLHWMSFNKNQSSGIDDELESSSGSIEVEISEQKPSKFMTTLEEGLRATKEFSSVLQKSSVDKNSLLLQKLA